MSDTKTGNKIFIDREEYITAAKSVLEEIATDPNLNDGGIGGLILGLTAAKVAGKIEVKLFGERTESED